MNIIRLFIQAFFSIYSNSSFHYASLNNPLIKLIPKSLIRNIFTAPPHNWSLLKCRSTSYFCKWTLSDATLLNSLISSNNLFIVSSGFSLYISSTNKNSFTLFFPNKPYGWIQLTGHQIDNFGSLNSSQFRLKKTEVQEMICLINKELSQEHGPMIHRPGISL